METHPGESPTWSGVPEQSTLDPISFVRLLRMRWPRILSAVLFGLLVGYLLAGNLAGNYTASVPLKPILSTEGDSSTVLDASTESLLFELQTDFFVSELREIAGDGVKRVTVSAPETASVVVVSIVAATPEEAEAGARGVGQLLERDRSASISSSRDADLASLQARVERYDQRIAEITAQLSAAAGNGTEGESPVGSAVEEALLADQVSRRADVLDQIDSIELEIADPSAGFEAFALDAVAAEPAQPTTPVVMVFTAVAAALLASGFVFMSGLRGGGEAVPQLLKARLQLPVVHGENGFEISTLAGRIARQRYRSVGVLTVGSGDTATSMGVVGDLAAALRAAGPKVIVVNHDLRTRGESTQTGRRGQPLGLAAYYLGRVGADTMVAEAMSGEGLASISRGELEPHDIARLHPERTSDLLHAAQRVADICVVAAADPNVVPEAGPVVSQLDAVLVVVHAPTDMRTVEGVLTNLSAGGVEPLAVATLQSPPSRFPRLIGPGAKAS
ncbi:MAG: hypothetical protein GEU79_10740 [Acidimicrobiia bacterium]|nr:hypothetical protein [Acidimicrobiia bacterium]